MADGMPDQYFKSLEILVWAFKIIPGVITDWALSLSDATPPVVSNVSTPD